jgi:hypothetical protein
MRSAKSLPSLRVTAKMEPGCGAGLEHGPAIPCGLRLAWLQRDMGTGYRSAQVQLLPAWSTLRPSLPAIWNLRGILCRWVSRLGR